MLRNSKTDTRMVMAAVMAAVMMTGAVVLFMVPGSIYAGHQNVITSVPEAETAINALEHEIVALKDELKAVEAKVDDWRNDEVRRLSALESGTGAQVPAQQQVPDTPEQTSPSVQQQMPEIDRVVTIYYDSPANTLIHTETTYHITPDGASGAYSVQAYREDGSKDYLVMYHPDGAIASEKWWWPNGNVQLQSSRDADGYTTYEKTWHENGRVQAEFTFCPSSHTIKVQQEWTDTGVLWLEKSDTCY